MTKPKVLEYLDDLKINKAGKKFETPKARVDSIEDMIGDLADKEQKDYDELDKRLKKVEVNIININANPNDNPNGKPVVVRSSQFPRKEGEKIDDDRLNRAIQYCLKWGIGLFLLDEEKYLITKPLRINSDKELGFTMQGEGIAIINIDSNSSLSSAIEVKSSGANPIKNVSLKDIIVKSDDSNNIGVALKNFSFIYLDKVQTSGLNKGIVAEDGNNLNMTQCKVFDGLFDLKNVDTSNVQNCNFYTEHGNHSNSVELNKCLDINFMCSNFRIKKVNSASVYVYNESIATFLACAFMQFDNTKSILVKDSRVSIRDSIFADTIPNKINLLEGSHVILDNNHYNLSIARTVVIDDQTGGHSSTFVKNEPRLDTDDKVLIADDSSKGNWQNYSVFKKYKLNYDFVGAGKLGLFQNKGCSVSASNIAMPNNGAYIELSHAITEDVTHVLVEGSLGSGNVLCNKSEPLTNHAITSVIKDGGRYFFALNDEISSLIIRGNCNIKKIMLYGNSIYKILP